MRCMRCVARRTRLFGRRVASRPRGQPARAALRDGHGQSPLTPGVRHAQLLRLRVGQPAPTRGRRGRRGPPRFVSGGSGDGPAGLRPAPQLTHDRRTAGGHWRSAGGGRARSVARHPRARKPLAATHRACASAPPHPPWTPASRQAFFRPRSSTMSRLRWRNTDPPSVGHLQPIMMRMARDWHASSVISRHRLHTP